MKLFLLTIQATDVIAPPNHSPSGALLFFLHRAHLQYFPLYNWLHVKNLRDGSVLQDSSRFKVQARRRKECVRRVRIRPPRKGVNRNRGGWAAGSGLLPRSRSNRNVSRQPDFCARWTQPEQIRTVPLVFRWLTPVQKTNEAHLPSATSAPLSAQMFVHTWMGRITKMQRDQVNWLVGDIRTVHREPR